ncbi:hypothetical protein SOVF_196320, partial [Spinacia oleracea]
MKPDVSLKIREEVSKMLEAGFIREAKYPEWIANVVPVPKKDGKIRMCVDYRDLNRASPKDDFPWPCIDILVDNTANHALLSFMDGYAGYNHITMAEEDMEKTTFITQWGTYCYTVMPFGLKNAGATYQRIATSIMSDMIHREIEVYVDDMIVKSKEQHEDTTVLRKFFNRLRQYNMRLNPQKCAFRVTSGKLLGYVISSQGIEADPSKIKAILDMKPPANEKEIWGFLSKLQYISRFISKLTMICEPIFRKLRKSEPKVWDEDSQHAFDTIKADPLKYIFEKPALNGQLSRWLVMLAEFDLKYIPQKSIKGSAVSDFLANSPIEAEVEDYDLPDVQILMTSDDSWSLHFDGASNQNGCGVGVILVAPDETHIPMSAKLQFNVTNNAVEYEACIMGLEAALALGVQKLLLYWDSSLIINQIFEKWKVRSKILAPYQSYLEKMFEQVEELRYTYLPREENQFADALEKQASIINIPNGMAEMPLTIETRQEAAYVHAIDDVEPDKNALWFTKIQ